jgi:predicted MFS family arabinose efflux permease
MTTNSGSARWALPFGVTLAAMFALQLSNLGFSPLLPSIQDEFGMNYKQFGLFTGIYGLLALALSVPAGLSAKRFGEKRVLGLGLLGVAAGSLLLSRAWNFESALAFRGLTIFGYRFAFVCVLVAVALTAPPSLRGRTMGILGATSALSSVIGSPLGGALTDRLGWRAAILAYAGAAVLGVIAFWSFYRPANTAEPAEGGFHGSGSTPGRSAFLSPVVWILALIVGLGGFGQFTITQFVPSVAKALYGLDARSAGVIISVGYMTAMAANLVVGWLTDRFNKLIVLGWVFTLLAIASS